MEDSWDESKTYYPFTDTGECIYMYIVGLVVMVAITRLPGFDSRFFSSAKKLIK